jgi:uncharacterized protein (TIGR00299 family) protein
MTKRQKNGSKQNSILYVDATSGIAGDMLLGALLDLNVPVEVFHEAWDKIALDNYQVEIFETRKSGLKALQCKVITEEKKGPRSWKEYQKILTKSKLKDSIREEALSLCKKLFEVEAESHGTSLSALHLHEMGGTDLLIDVVGTLAAIDYLQPSQIFSSPVNTGKGFVRFSHGNYPVPAPATAKLLEGVPIFQNEVSGELTTPTGALLLTHLTKEFGALPEMQLQKVGIGAGERDTGEHPNVVRIFSGLKLNSTREEEVSMLETNVDDSSPQILAYFMEKAFESGALDVFFTPIFMKKNRPAVRLSILAPETKRDELVQLLFSETSAIGLRYWKVGRQKLERKWTTVKIKDAEVRIKESFLNGTRYNYQPEYEDCKVVAQRTGLPVKEVIAHAIQAYLNEMQDA